MPLARSAQFGPVGQLSLLALWWSVLLLWSFTSAAQTGRTAPVLHVAGAIGPATSDYITRELARAAEDRAPVVVIQVDTPGGLDTSMREIIRAILRSPVPVVTYVSPSGARAASAGAFILYASHIAAMAPGTNVGAATPVQLAGGSPFSSPSDEAGKRGGSGKAASASEAKALNDAVAYIRSLAELRGRNAEWAEAAVRNAASLSARAALEQTVIDFMARDRTELLAQVHGRTVTAGGQNVALNTQNLALVDVNPDWRTRLLTVITDPNIALILMMIGIYGLMFEFMSPGALYPGVIGAICLLTGLYALTALPVNYAGAALILLGVGLMTAEAFSPSFGVLGVGGVAAFVLGAAIMIDTDVAEFQISWMLLGVLAVVSLAMSILITRLALTSHRRKIVSGREEMIGAVGRVLDWDGEHGHVFVRSERWRARSYGAIEAGALVCVNGLDGLILDVEPVDEPSSATQSVDHHWES